MATFVHQAARDGECASKILELASCDPDISTVEAVSVKSIDLGGMIYLLLFPIGSMYGIYANIGGILMVNVTIYSSTIGPIYANIGGIHGSYGF
jgi:hypothetical protein